LLEDLIRPFKLILLIVPIDLEAPAGRLILPQVQTIREVLDSDSATLVVKEREVSWALDQLKRPPDLAITDSQVVLKAAGAVPPEIPLTTFSVLFSRFKGDLDLFVRNARKIDRLRHGSRVLITESCSHHAHCDDIGRVKIPRWLRQYTGKELEITHSGGTFPEDISPYDLLIHCGGCMITRNQMLQRVAGAGALDAPITNYGVAISHLHGLLDRVLEPFET
jgi:[FeFe] hydrogenase H-cluster maturation GTPase HydF